MKRRWFLGLVLLFITAGSPFVACAGDEPTTGEMRQAMVDMVTAIEKAGGIGSDAADQVRFAEDEVIEAFFVGMDRREIVETSRRIVAEIERASATDEAPFSPAADTFGYTPDYPGWSEISFETARAYGLVDYPWNRCSGTAFEDWKESMFWYGYALDQAEPTCVVSGCDPTGIICAIDCGIVSVAMIVYNGLKIGVESCDKHDANVNGAEIEASYENSLSDSSGIADLAQDLGTHDALVRNQVASHHATIHSVLSVHDAETRARLAALTAALGALQATVDTEMETRQVHVEVLEVIPGERFLLASTESGRPVDVTLVEVKASRLLDDFSGVEFVTLPASGTPIPGATGMLDVQVRFPPGLRIVPKVVQFQVKDTHTTDGDAGPIEHYGSAMVTSRGTTVVAPAKATQRSGPAQRRFR